MLIQRMFIPNKAQREAADNLEKIAGLMSEVDLDQELIDYDCRYFPAPQDVTDAIAIWMASSNHEFKRIIGLILNYYDATLGRVDGAVHPALVFQLYPREGTDSRVILDVMQNWEHLMKPFGEQVCKYEEGRVLQAQAALEGEGGDVTEETVHDYLRKAGHRMHKTRVYSKKITYRDSEITLFFDLLGCINYEEHKQELIEDVECGDFPLVLDYNDGLLDAFAVEDPADLDRIPHHEFTIM